MQTTDLAKLSSERLLSLWRSRKRESRTSTLQQPGMDNRRRYVLRELAKAWAELDRRGVSVV